MNLEDSMRKANRENRAWRKANRTNKTATRTRPSVFGYGKGSHPAVNETARFNGITLISPVGTLLREKGQVAGFSCVENAQAYNQEHLDGRYSIVKVARFGSCYSGNSTTNILYWRGNGVWL